MLTALIRMLVQALAQGVADRGNASASGGGRAYYSGVVTTIVFLPLAVFLVLVGAGLANVSRGYESSWSIVLIGLCGIGAFGFLMAREFWKREVRWNDQGVRFRWLSGEADLKWADIEKVEVRTLQRNYARIQFRDGRTFGVSTYLTGSRELLRELARHGVAFYKWGTSTPVSLAA